MSWKTNKAPTAIKVSGSKEKEKEDAYLLGVFSKTADDPVAGNKLPNQKDWNTDSTDFHRFFSKISSENL